MAINIGMYSYQYFLSQGSATSRRIVYTHTAHGLTTDAYITRHSDWYIVARFILDWTPYFR
jgi:hypothetical protein